MNKLKKAIANLDSYLGKDSSGLSRLKAVSLCAAEIRKDAAAARDEAESLRAECERLSRRVISLESSLSASSAESQRLASLVRQQALDLSRAADEAARLQKEINSHLQPTEIPEPDERDPGGKVNGSDLSPLVRDMPAFIRLFDSLRREMRVAPQGGGLTGGDPRCFSLEKLVGSYSDAEMLKLGKFVLCYSLVFGPVAILAEYRWKTAKTRGWVFSDNQMAKCFRWFCKNNVDMRDEDERARGGDPRIGRSQNIDFNSGRGVRYE